MRLIKTYFLLALIIYLTSCNSSNNVTPYSEVIFLADKETALTFELYRTDVKGSAIKRISHDLPLNGDVIDFSLSPNGEYVAYRATSGNSTLSELFISYINGGITYKVSGDFPVQPPVTAGVYQYAWSADSRYLAYLASHQGDINYKTLFVTNTIDRSSVNVTPNTEAASFLWSPDSLHISCTAIKINDVNSLGIYIVDKNGQNEIKVSGNLQANETVFNDGYFWSPDGLYLTYVKRNSSSIEEMYIVMANGTNNTNLSNGINAIPEYWTWAPNSSRIAYVADQDTPDTYELYSVLPDGTDVVKLSSLQNLNEDVSGFSWAPDSSRIVYRSGEVGSTIQLYTVTPGGMSHTKISGSLVNDEQVFPESFYWSNNSSRIAYLANPTTAYSQLFVVNPDGSDLVSISNTTLIDSNIKADPIWSPDSNNISFQADTNNTLKLFSVNLSNYNIVQLSQESSILGGSVIFKNFTWTSDSKHVIYKATFDDPPYDKLYSVSLDDVHNNNISGTMVPGGHVDIFDVP